jgi:hypothetical protein
MALNITADDVCAAALRQFTNNLPPPFESTSVINRGQSTLLVLASLFDFWLTHHEKSRSYQTLLIRIFCFFYSAQ